MSATSSVGRSTGASAGGRRGGSRRGRRRTWEQVEGTHGRTDLRRRDAQIPRGGFETAMPEEQLNRAHVSPGFEEMDGERMSQRMWRDGFGERRSAMRALTRL